MGSTLSRRELLQCAGLSALGATGWMGYLSAALAKGDLPTVQGLHDVKGSVSINGRASQRGAALKPGDRVVTGDGGQAILVVGKDALLLRANTNVLIESDPKTPGVLSGLAVAAGKVLSVFAKRVAGESGVSIRAPNATIGIRGTGAYVEIHDGRSYLCLCYGEAALDGKGVTTPSIIKTTHHESPVWLDDRSGVLKVEKGPMLDHNDEELILLEKLTGREPPFVAMGLTGRY
jgi:hypothetical protein